VFYEIMAEKHYGVDTNPELYTCPSFFSDKTARIYLQINYTFSDMHQQHNCGGAGSMSWGVVRRIDMNLDWNIGV
jgi:hypothetical protein